MNRLLMLKVFYSALLLMPSGANVVRLKKLKIRKSLIFNFLRIVLRDPFGARARRRKETLSKRSGERTLG